MTNSPRFLCIPDIGTRVRLEEDWTFALYQEHRNNKLIEVMFENRQYDWNNHGKPIDFITLEKGTELKVGRVYIRNGLGNFSSLTFTIQATEDQRFYMMSGGKKPRKTLKKVRFWAKLADVNEAKMLVIADPSIDATIESLIEEEDDEDSDE